MECPTRVNADVFRVVVKAEPSDLMCLWLIPPLLLSALTTDLRCSGRMRNFRQKLFCHRCTTDILKRMQQGCWLSDQFIKLSLLIKETPKHGAFMLDHITMLVSVIACISLILFFNQILNLIPVTTEMRSWSTWLWKNCIVLSNIAVW